MDRVILVPPLCACLTYKETNYHWFKERDHLEDLRVNGTIYKTRYSRIGYEEGTDWTGSG
jgi:hypothetical protein